MAGDFNNSFAVREENQKLLIEMSNLLTNSTEIGYCMDIFHPSFEKQFLEPILLRNMIEVYQGFWLEKNTPVIKKSIQEIYDPWVLPYRPGNAFNVNDTQTLPEIAQHGG